MGLIGDYAPFKLAAGKSEESDRDMKKLWNRARGKEVQSDQATSPINQIDSKGKKMFTKKTAEWTDMAEHIWDTSIPKDVNPRSYFLDRPDDAVDPILAVTPFVPKNMVYHLMTKKKPSAMGVKYKQGDEVTNMEAMLHHFVTPLVPILMTGDYAYKGGHSLVSLGSNKEGKQKARVVILSALVQPDLEYKNVVFELAKLGPERLEGRGLGDDFVIPSAKVKADPTARRAYDSTLKRHAVYHLLAGRALPSTREVKPAHCLDMNQAIAHLEKVIVDPDATPQVLSLTDLFITVGYGDQKSLLSLEIMASISFHQMHNEFRVLERMIPHGYVYTFDPASIFAAQLDPTLLNRLTILGVRRAVHICYPGKMKSFAFNDYVDGEAINLLRRVFQGSARKSVSVISKSKLFPGPKGLYDPSQQLGRCEAALVVHNNSDGFGQNIQTEPPGMSLDGSYGAYSSAAASLRRERDWTRVEIV